MAIFFEIISIRPPICSILAKRKAACKNYTPPDRRKYLFGLFNHVLLTVEEVDALAQ